MTEHYAVVYEESVYIPGDERSRTNPGHGYPAETRYYKVYKPFNSLEELESWIKLNGKNTKFQALRCQPLEVTTVTKVVIK